MIFMTRPSAPWPAISSTWTVMSATPWKWTSRPATRCFPIDIDLKKEPIMNDSKSKKRLLIGIGVFLLVAGSAAAWFFRADPVDDVRRLRNQLFSEEGKKLSPEERKEGFQKLATDMKNLTPQQRKELFAERQKKISEDLDRFFKLSPEEQTAELDRKIDQMLAGKKAWENGGQRRPGGRKGLGRTGRPLLRDPRACHL